LGDFFVTAGCLLQFFDPLAGFACLAQAKAAFSWLALCMQTSPAATSLSVPETVNRQDFADCVRTTMNVRAYDALAAANFHSGTNFKPVSCPQR
jgi:hypothetical protein